MITRALEQLGVPGVHAVGACVALALVGVPAGLAWRNEERAADASVDAAGALQAERNAWASLRKERDALEGRERALVERVSRAPTLPREDEITSLLAGITRTAEAHGLGVRSADVGEPQTEGKLLAVPLRLEVSGGYVQGAAFMRSLWETYPSVSVEQFGLRSGGAGGAEGAGWFALRAYADRTGQPANNP